VPPILAFLRHLPQVPRAITNFGNEALTDPNANSLSAKYMKKTRGGGPKAELFSLHPDRFNYAGRA
jgi:hypothetical protein